MSTTASTDRFQKEIVLRAPRSRVWRALSQSEEFATWFGLRLNGAFAPGAKVSGTIVDPPGYEHLDFEVFVERVEPERLMSFRWHPYAIDPKADYSSEPTTLVELTLEEVAGGTRLTVSESGFDKIPEHRRAEAYRSNQGGWEEQLKRIARHVEK